MQERIYKIDLDIKKSNKIPFIEVVKGDKGTNVFEITLKDDDKIYDLTDTIVSIIFRKSDKTTVVQSSEDMELPITITDNIIYCELKTNTIARDGKVLSEVIVTDLTGKVLTSQRFHFYVRNSLMSDDVIESTDEFPLLDKLITKVEELILIQTDMIEKENIREENEQLRIALYLELLELKSVLEALKITLETTNSNVEDNENKRIINENVRIENEILRETLYENLLQLQTDLLALNITIVDLIDEANTAINNANNAATNANNVSNAITQAEGLRVEAENLRVIAESARVVAEQNRATTFEGYEDRVSTVEQDLVAHKEDYMRHLDDNMPHEVKDLQSTKTYKFGLQLSTEGNPQIIFEEVI